MLCETAATCFLISFRVELTVRVWAFAHLDIFSGKTLKFVRIFLPQKYEGVLRAKSERGNTGYTKAPRRNTCFFVCLCTTNFLLNECMTLRLTCKLYKGILTSCVRHVTVRGYEWKSNLVPLTQGPQQFSPWPFENPNKEKDYTQFQNLRQRWKIGQFYRYR